MTGTAKRHAAALNLAAATGRSRPHRHRTPTTHYSDDNPNTFTKKKKRRRGQPADDSDNSDDGDDTALMAPPPPPTAPQQLLEPSRKRPRPSSTTSSSIQALPPPPPPPPPPPADVVLPHTVTVSPVFPLQVGKNPPKSLRQEFPVVFGQGLGLPPPLAKPSWQPITSVHRDFYFPQDYQPQTVANEKTVPFISPSTPTVSRSISCLTVEKTEQQYMAMADTAGFVTLYSLHPKLVEITRLETTHATDREYHDQWQHHRLLLQNIKKPKTGMALVTGTAATTAQQHPAFDRFQDVNVIQAMSFSGSLLVLATLMEIECWSVSSPATSSPQRLWTHSWNQDHLKNTVMCPLQLDLAFSVNSIIPDRCLASFFVGNRSTKEETAPPSSTAAAAVTTTSSSSIRHSPLWMLSPSPRISTLTQEEVQANTIERSTTVLSSEASATELRPSIDGKVPQLGAHCTAIWDAFYRDCPRILMTPLVIISDKVDKQYDDQPNKNGNAVADEPASGRGRHHSQQPHRRQELWLVEQHSSEFVVKQRAIVLPKVNLKSPALEATLCQASSQYTLVACSKGIRLYVTETLHLLQVYGEHLALHGQSVMWQDVLVCPRLATPDPTKHSATSGGGGAIIRNRAIEYTDYLALGSIEQHVFVKDEKAESAKVNDNGSTSEWLNEGRAWIIGVPHPERGPRELCETLHVWDFGRGDCKTPTFTVAGPSTRSKGIQSLVVVTGYKGGPTTSTNEIEGSNMRLILCTKSGDCLEYAPTMQSDWPGIMYPPDYHLIAENLEYIEDEDELDVLVDEASTYDDDENDESLDLALRKNDILQEEDFLVAKAMQLSVQEIAVSGGTGGLGANLDVINGTLKRHSSIVISCRPEAHLRQSLYPELKSRQDNDAHEKEFANASNSLTNSSRFLLTKVMPSLPQRALVRARVQSQLFRPFFPVPNTTAEPTPSEASACSSNSGKPAAKGGKRSRAANLEAMLKASIDPSLRRFMLSKEKLWTDGSASSIRPKDRLIATTAQRDESTRFQTHVASREEETVLALGLLQLSPVKPAASQTAVTNVVEASIGRRVVDGPSPRYELSCVTLDSENGISASQSLEASFARPEMLRLETFSNVVSGAHAQLGYTMEEQAPPSRRLPSGSRLTMSRSCQESNCDACRGRLTAHICGARAMPIDFDALIQAENEQKKKEEDDKRKATAEKRRAAAARRKEAKLRSHKEQVARNVYAHDGFTESRQHQENFDAGNENLEHYSIRQASTSGDVRTSCSNYQQRQHPEFLASRQGNDSLRSVTTTSEHDGELQRNEILPLPVDFPPQNPTVNDSDFKLMTAQTLAAFATIAEPVVQVSSCIQVAANGSCSAHQHGEQAQIEPTSLGSAGNDYDTAATTMKGNVDMASQGLAYQSDPGGTYVHTPEQSGHGFVLQSCNEVDPGVWIKNPPPFDLSGASFAGNRGMG